MSATFSPHQEPATGDPVVDQALLSLGQTDPEDVEAQIAAGERFERDLTARLGDLAAE